MEKFDLQAIWQQSATEEPELPSFVAAKELVGDRSLNLVERIKRTARREHRTFLIAAAIGCLLLLAFQHFLWAGGLVIFTGLMIWKYEVEMGMINRIKPEHSTLEYLRAVSSLLERFMQNYRYGILIFIPLVAIGGALLGQYRVIGRIDWTFWLRPVMIGYLAAAIAVAILFSRWWLKTWVNTFYGKKLREMRIVIDELEAI
ncbi:hypothetical protein [Flavilitoribacter nigricans]|uniref:Uncharacterized protein n=1 Tax=Flavilitoribacter nigricans (strain ATCC 23147 / DSM 23189 / NBRC 102662 / NCIMB 1420 / SS-2) TaxID=1122177 RepID=A0A2D0N8I7_FLAN2|nr:hypothetical protein [Flavilitoribacter nigricans]PHN04832.1 hypothetical protein CRP01_20190 [Flavilitoribacter nigricans DSM 23189 = NBRC 102662]